MAAPRSRRRTSSPRLLTKAGHRSQFEDKIAADLEVRGIDYEYEKLKVDFVPPPKRKRYTPDFTSKRLPPNVVIEAKGWFKSEDRTKHLDIQASRPDIEVRFVFQNARRTLSKTSKTTYADWCSKKGFRWAEGRVPEEWFVAPDKARSKPDKEPRDPEAQTGASRRRASGSRLRSLRGSRRSARSAHGDRRRAR